MRHNGNIKEDDTMVKYFTQHKGTNLDLKFELNRHGGHKARSHRTWVQILTLLPMSHILCKYLLCLTPLSHVQDGADDTNLRTIVRITLDNPF